MLMSAEVLVEVLIGRSSCSVLAGPNCLPHFICSISLSTPLSGSSSHFSPSGFVFLPAPSPSRLSPLLSAPSPSLYLSSLSLLLWSYPPTSSFSNLPLVLGSMTCQWRGDCPCPGLIRQLIIQHFPHQGKWICKQTATHIHV